MKVHGPVGQEPVNKSYSEVENELFDLDIREFRAEVPVNLTNGIGPMVATTITTTTTVSVIKYTLMLRC